ncbi:MAG: thiamine phosphate synthase [Alphaproteobacteria bacterium]
MTIACELYPRVPASLLAGPEAAAGTGTGALLRSGVSALLLTGADQPGLALGLVHTFVTAAQGRDISVLVENDVQLAKVLNASGVHFSTPAEQTPQEVRALLGDDALVGASCGLSRHDAMTLCESGVDYVAFVEPSATDAGLSESFEDVAAMLQWWSELFETPSVAWGQDSHDEAVLQAFITAGADYLSLPAAYWLDENAAAKLSHLLSVCTARSIPA